MSRMKSELCDDPSRDQAITKDRDPKTTTCADSRQRMNVHDLHQHDRVRHAVVA